jgi:hypothetical protein
MQVEIKWDKATFANVMGAIRSKVIDIESNSGAILIEVAQKIMAESQEECPVDTGNLKSTAHILEPVKEGHKTTVNMGYGGPNDKLRPKPDFKTGRYKMASEYMLEVHELLGTHHPHGNAKFLENPVTRNVNWFISHVNNRVSAIIKRGGAVTNVR